MFLSSNSAQNKFGMFDTNFVVITARKRSLGQGNVFTGVCLSTGESGSRGVSALWSGGASGFRGYPPDTPPSLLDTHSLDTPHGQQAEVRILLECFLFHHTPGILKGNYSTAGDKGTS